MMNVVLYYLVYKFNPGGECFRGFWCYEMMVFGG
jgi:hypothetical protein